MIIPDFFCTKSQWYARNLFLSTFFTFPSIFSSVRVARPYFFTDAFLEVKSVFNYIPSTCVKNDFSCLQSCLKRKSPIKMEKSQNFLDAPKSILEIFKSTFYDSFNIFISTCRTTLICLPTNSLKLGEYFAYLQRVLKMINLVSGTV